MHDFLQDLLQCPACAGTFQWTIAEQHGNHIEVATAECNNCGTTYPVRQGIGLFLTPDLPRDDLWDQAESGLARHLRQNPAVARQLMDSPLADLNPADQFFRALTLEDQAEFAAAKTAEQTALLGLYTDDYRRCWQVMVDDVLTRLGDVLAPIVDLASGRGYLAEKLLAATAAPLVVTDFSPRVLRRNRAWLQMTGQLDRVSLLAFDARRTPFKDSAVSFMTTNLGLPNISESALLWAELRRILGGPFLAVSHFYPEHDGNADDIANLGLADQVYKARLLTKMAANGLQTNILTTCTGRAAPTPKGEVIAGAGIDGLPRTMTWLEWCVLQVEAAPA